MKGLVSSQSAMWPFNAWPALTSERQALSVFRSKAICWELGHTPSCDAGSQEDEAGEQSLVHGPCDLHRVLA